MPRILYICSSWPLGPIFGGQLRSLHIARALQQSGDVDVLMVGSEAGDNEARLATASAFSTLAPIAPEPALIPGLRGKFRRAFDRDYMNLHGYACSPEDRARVDGMIAQYDLVWVLNSRTPNLLQRWSWPHSHLDIDDLPSTYLRTMAQNGQNLAARLKARLQQRLMHRRELRFRDRFVTLSVCSAEDKAYLDGDDRVFIIPNGFARPAANPPRSLQPASPRLGFIGLYSYAPNLDGVRWFLAECWPAIRQAEPGVRLRLIGKETDGPLKPSEPDVDALGWVADPSDEIATWSAMIVPIRFGGGTRIKIAEAFSRKCPAISTRIGAFGYEVSHGRQLLIADNAPAFVDACISLIRNPARGTELADQAWSDFLANWTWEAITKRVKLAVSASLSAATAH